MQCHLKAFVPAGLVVTAMLLTPAPADAQRSGVEVWSQSCGRCHRPQPANRYTAGQWETIMTQMQIYTRLTDDETDAILEFLSGAAKPLAQAESTTPDVVVPTVSSDPLSNTETSEGRAAVVPTPEQMRAVARYIRAFSSQLEP